MTGTDHLRLASEQLRRRVAASIDVDRELEALRANGSPNDAWTPIDETASVNRSAGRYLAVAVAIAALVSGGVLVLRARGGGDQLLTAGEPTAVLMSSAPVEASPAASSPTISTTVDELVNSTAVNSTAVTTADQTSTASISATSTTSTSVAPSTTVAPVAPVSPGGRVSYLDPPPVVPLRQLASVALAYTGYEGSSPIVDFAIGDLGVVVNQSHQGHVVVVGFDGSQRSVDVETQLGAISYGPGHVLYGFAGEPLVDFAMAAVPLSGPRAGTVVARQAAGWVQYTELPFAAFGHGSTGIIDRVRDGNAQLIPYVDVDGAPITWSAPAPPLLTVDYVDRVDRVGDIITADDGRRWRLDVGVSPDAASPYVDPTLSAPSSGDLAVHWTYIGPNAKPEQDFGEPTMPVIAQLRRDGSVTWWSLPEGWKVVASDLWGTVVARFGDGSVDVALVDFG